MTLAELLIRGGATGLILGVLLFLLGFTVAPTPRISNPMMTGGIYVALLSIALILLTLTWRPDLP